MAKDNQKSDLLSGILTGVIFICVGMLLFADKQNMLDAGWFWWLLVGIGALLILEAGLRLSLPRYRRPLGVRLVWGAILIALGSSQIDALDNWWPVIFILVGVIMIGNAVRSQT